MAVEKLERSQIRAWIYERLRQGKTGSLDLQLSDLGLYVRGKAITAGLLEQRPFEANYDIPQPIADLVRETAWELTFQGILVPGVGIGGATGDPGFPFFQISEWGKSSLDSGEYLPYDATQFVDRLTKKITGIDPIILLYITEALISFRCEPQSNRPWTPRRGRKTLPATPQHGRLSEYTTRFGRDWTRTWS
jgi:hypothetical protein